MVTHGLQPSDSLHQPEDGIIASMAATTLDPQVCHSITALAGEYADRVVASLPEEDPDVLHAGLVGAFVTFLVDAVGVVEAA